MDILTEREGNMGSKPMSTETKPRLTSHWFSRGDNFPCYPLVQSIYLLYYTECWLNTSSTLRFQNNPGQVNIWVCMSYSVNSNAHTTPVRTYGESYAHKFCRLTKFYSLSHLHMSRYSDIVPHTIPWQNSLSKSRAWRCSWRMLEIVCQPSRTTFSIRGHTIFIFHFSEGHVLLIFCNWLHLIPIWNQSNRSPISTFSSDLHFVYQRIS